MKRRGTTLGQHLNNYGTSSQWNSAHLKATLALGANALNAPNTKSREAIWSHLVVNRSHHVIKHWGENLKTNSEVLTSVTLKLYYSLSVLLLCLSYLSVSWHLYCKMTPRVHHVIIMWSYSHSIVTSFVACTFCIIKLTFFAMQWMIDGLWVHRTFDVLWLQN